ELVYFFALVFESLFGSREVLPDDRPLCVARLELLDLLLELARLRSLLAVEKVVGGPGQQERQQQEHGHLVVPGEPAEEVAALFVPLNNCGHRRCHNWSPYLPASFLSLSLSLSPSARGLL